MKDSRRRFIKITGLTGVGIVGNGTLNALNLGQFDNIINKQSSAKVEIKTVQNKRINSDINKVNTKDQQIYTIHIVNEGEQSQNLVGVNVIITPDELIPDGTTYVIGPDASLRREGNVVISQTDKPFRNYDNNMCIMFKKNETDYMLVGVISWRTYLCQIFTDKGLVYIQGDCDNQPIQVGESLAFEKVVCLYDSSWQNLLDRYADLIAKENNVPLQPKVSWKGWATWDYYGQKFLPDDITHNIQAIKELKVRANIIQIDGGWWKIRGDYYDVRDNIQGGIKAMVEQIHNNGLKAGLHFDGFRASKAAEIVKNHPEYFLHNVNGQLLEKGRDQTKEPLVLWDYSHPGAQKYITDVMANARNHWKVDYFKIDFMREGLLTKGVSYQPVTRVERFRMGIAAIRKGIKDGYFLGCGGHSGVNIGLTEAIRTGKDIFPNYEAVKERVQQNSGNYYFNKRLYYCDPDYIVLRSEKESDERDSRKPTLTYDQAMMWANFVSIFGNIRIQSDEISLLSNDKKELIQKSFHLPFFELTIPLDWWDHYKTDNDPPNIYLAKGENGEICLGLFNWEQQNQIFNISGFKRRAFFKDFLGDARFITSNNAFSVSLNGIKSILLQYKGTESFDQLREELRLKKDIKQI